MSDHSHEEGIYLEQVVLPVDVGPFVYLTRDSYADGELSRIVEVWSTAPKLSTDWLGHNGLWLDESETNDLLCRVALAGAEKRFRTVPEAVRECIKVPTK